MTTAIVLLTQRCCATFEGKANFFWDRLNGIGLYAYIDAGNGLVVCPECGKVYQWDTESGGETEPGGEAMALSNVDFEDEFTQREAPEIKIAKGWQFWYVDRNTWFVGDNKRPECGPELRTVGQGRVRSGDRAQKMFSPEFSICRAGIFQEVATVPNHWYRFSIWVWVWTTSLGDVNQSNSKLHARAGANPWGGGPYHYASVTGQEALVYDSWQQVEVIFQAWGSKATVFTEMMPEYAVRHNDTYWDDAALEEIGEPGTEPEEPEEPVEPGACLFDASEILSRIALAEETILGRINRLGFNVEPE